MASATLPLAGPLLDRAALIGGFVAACIGIGAFIGPGQAVLATRGDREVQVATAMGGVVGLISAIVVVGAKSLRT